MLVGSIARAGVDARDDVQERRARIGVRTTRN
jgi:hypothetical protein